MAKKSGLIKTAMAVEEVKKGIIKGIEIVGNNSILHMSAVTMAVTHYLMVYSETYHEPLDEIVDDFIEGLKTLEVVDREAS